MNEKIVNFTRNYGDELDTQILNDALTIAQALLTPQPEWTEEERAAAAAAVALCREQNSIPTRVFDRLISITPIVKEIDKESGHSGFSFGLVMEGIVNLLAGWTIVQETTGRTYSLSVEE